ncbi:MAG: geopeptide radical SAM maturase [Nitrospirae bacterium]|nr:geopeptide radical SAM maturase [Nitrospirota bacterium]
MFELSAYSKIFDNPQDPESLLLFSTKQVSSMEIDKSLLADIGDGSISAEERDTLIELGFLVERAAERREMSGFMDEMNLLNTRLRAIVVMNLDCNLACRYCFEGARKGPYFMTRDTADGVIAFIKSKAITGIQALDLTFYGGEPLLTVDLVEYIADALRLYADDRGLEFGFSFITNGTLMSADTVRRLLPLGMTGAAVTLDGPPAVHDSLRPFKSGAGSFDLIVKNLGEVCDMVGLAVGGNYTKESYKFLPELLDLMIERGLTPGRISAVKFDPVSIETPEIAPPDFHEGCASLNEDWIAEAGISLREEILKRGFGTQRIKPVTCMIEFSNAMVINYDGSIYKCPGLISRREFCVGDILSGVQDYHISHAIDNWKNKECLDCAYLPLCFGGCRYLKFVRDGNMEGVDCRKQYFDATLEAFVKQDIKYGLTG